jgi:hypothetical protein
MEQGIAGGKWDAKDYPTPRNAGKGLRPHAHAAEVVKLWRRVRLIGKEHTDYPPNVGHDMRGDLAVPGA